MLTIEHKKTKTVKTDLKLLACVLALIVTVVACRKDKEPQRYYPVSPPQAPPQPSGFIVGNKEYFWGEAWHKTSAGYKINLNTWKLTDSTISKGINVSVAMWTEMTIFERIPMTFYDFVNKDSVHLSFTAKPGQLRVTAQAPFELNYESDVLIEYE